VTLKAIPVLFELLDHVDRLKAMHRAGETPTNGEVERLFDLASGLRVLLEPCEALQRPPAWPTQGTPVEKAARRLVELVAASLAQKGGAT
jgi:hypothetical protein